MVVVNFGDGQRRDDAETASRIQTLERRLERERAIRQQAEQIAETGLLELYEKQRLLELMEAVAKKANISIILTTLGW